MKKVKLNVISIFMTSIRGGINTILLVLLALQLSINVFFIIMFLLFTFIELRSIINIHKIVINEDFSQTQIRNKLLENFGKAEAFEFFRIATLLLLTQYWYMFIVIVVYGLVWFITMNKILFGSKFGPRV